MDVNDFTLDVWEVRTEESVKVEQRVPGIINGYRYILLLVCLSFSYLSMSYYFYGLSPITDGKSPSHPLC